MSFYNTTQEKGRKLDEFQQHAETQEEKVLKLFLKTVGGMTASEVFRRYPDKRTPLTSIRRAINNLVNDKRLVKSTEKRDGMYGRPEYVFRLYTGQMLLF